MCVRVYVYARALVQLHSCFYIPLETRRLKAAAKALGFISAPPVIEEQTLPFWVLV